jgi:hypothetical protein
VYVWVCEWTEGLTEIAPPPYQPAKNNNNNRNILERGGLSWWHSLYIKLFLCNSNLYSCDDLSKKRASLPAPRQRILGHPWALVCLQATDECVLFLQADENRADPWTHDV